MFVNVSLFFYSLFCLIHNLSHFFSDRVYKAGNGEHGSGANMHGKDGEDLIINVPPGTVVVNTETNEIIVK